MVISDSDAESIIQYNQMNPTVKEYMSKVDYSNSTNDYSTTEIIPYQSAETIYSKEEPSGLKVEAPEGTKVTIAQGSKTMEQTISGQGYIYNIEPYKYATITSNNKSYKIASSGQVRMIYTPSVWNVRDLGGWACTGGKIKYGKIYRGGHFGNITDSDKVMLVDWIGINTDIDLRNSSETNNITTSPLGGKVEYYHQGINYYANAVNAGAAQTILVIKKIIANISLGKTCYFHCVSGADRTATIAYIILSLLGVSQSDKDKDYELTGFSDEKDGRRFRNTSYEVATGNSWYALVKYFRDNFSGENDNEKVVAWAIANGITAEEINAFRAAMITGEAGEVITPEKTYTVTNTLTGCTTNNSLTTITNGDSYYAVITAKSGYTIKNASVIVKMGGTNVTDLYYNNGIINIPDVSGNIEIAITAAVYVPTYTNVLSTAVDPGTKSGAWDGKGYRNGAYASSAKPYYGSDAACWCTGAIAVQPSDVLYVKGATLEGSGHERLGAFSGATGGCYFVAEFSKLSGKTTVTKLGDKYYKIVLDSSYENYSNIGYIMFSAQGTGDGVVVTKNEEITD